MDIKQVREMIQKAHLPEKTVHLCLRGDLQGELDDLQYQLQQVAKTPRESLSDDGGAAETREILDRMEQLRDEMESAKIPVKLRALERPKWMKLLAKHPPRKDDPGDRGLGVNAESFFDELIYECWVTPELDRDEIRSLLDVLTAAQFEKLQEAAWMLNRRDVDVPFSRNALRSMRPSARTSEQQSE